MRRRRKGNGWGWRCKGRNWLRRWRRGSGVGGGERKVHGARLERESLFFSSPVMIPRCSRKTFHPFSRVRLTGSLDLVKVWGDRSPSHPQRSIHMSPSPVIANFGVSYLLVVTFLSPQVCIRRSPSRPFFSDGIKTFQVSSHAGSTTGLLSVTRLVSLSTLFTRNTLRGW